MRKNKEPTPILEIFPEYLPKTHHRERKFPKSLTYAQKLQKTTLLETLLILIKNSNKFNKQFNLFQHENTTHLTNKIKLLFNSISKALLVFNSFTT